MHVVRDKSTKQVIYIDHSTSTSILEGEVVYDNFNSKTMELGWTDKPYLSAYFDIDADGNIKELSLAQAVEHGMHTISPGQKLENGCVITKTKSELVRDGLVDMQTIKQEKIHYFSNYSFEKRREIIPDYKLENALLGVYEDDERTKSYRNTINSFRNEYKRIEAAINAATSVEEIELIKPNFPNKLVPSDSD